MSAWLSKPGLREHQGHQPLHGVAQLDLEQGLPSVGTRSGHRQLENSTVALTTVRPLGDPLARL